jgi:hypothetical protein
MSGRRRRVHEAVDVADAALLGDDHVKSDVGVRGVGRAGVPLEPGLVVVGVDLAAERERDSTEAFLRLRDEPIDLLGPLEIDVRIGIGAIGALKPFEERSPTIGFGLVERFEVLRHKCLRVLHWSSDSVVCQLGRGSSRTGSVSITHGVSEGKGDRRLGHVAAALPVSSRIVGGI